MKRVFLLLFLFISLRLTAQESLSFIVVSDLHFDQSKEMFLPNDSIIEKINQIKNDVILWDNNKSFDVSTIRGVIVTGDVTSDGSMGSFEEFRSLYGLNGEKKLIYPVYEAFGNHDGNIDGYVRTQIKERNKCRKDLQSISDNGLHYSWEWDGVKLIQLNLYPANEWNDTCKWCHYFKTTFRDPQCSLLFLESELGKIKDKSQPIVIFMHYGWDDFSKLWWTEDDMNIFYETIKDYNIIGIFHGHDHGYKAYNWNGLNIIDAGSTVNNKKNTGCFILVNIKDGNLIHKALNYK